jgi:type VI secretion system protein VasD
MSLVSARSRSRSRSFHSASALALGLTLGLTVASLSACKNKNQETCKPDDYTFKDIEVHIQAADTLNLDDEGNSLPTVVRIYQLSGDLSTRNLDFTELWEDHESALGDDYISHKEFQIYPDSSEVLPIAPEKDARFLLAFGVFQQPVGNTWFRVYEIPDTYGKQACQLKDDDKDPATLGQPCAYLFMERNQIDGGKSIPPGFDKNKVEAVCTPLYSPKPPSEDDGKKKKKKKKK